MKKKLFAAFLVTGMSFAVLNGSACSLQGEGDRCDSKNGDLDCQEGLTCVNSKQLGGSADICCPPAGSTNPECTKSTDPTTTSTGTSTVTSTTDATTTSTTDTTTTDTTATTSSGGGAGGKGAGGSGIGGSGGTKATSSTSTN